MEGSSDAAAPRGVPMHNDDMRRPRLAHLWVLALLTPIVLAAWLLGGVGTTIAVMVSVAPGSAVFYPEQRGAVLRAIWKAVAVLLRSGRM